MLATKFRFIWAKRFQRIFKNRPTSNTNCLWWPCLLMDRDEMSILYKRPSIDASNQVSINLAKRFQRRRLRYEKLTDDGCQVMPEAHLWQDELKIRYCLFVVYLPIHQKLSLSKQFLL